jgi:hypothetical protein
MDILDVNELTSGSTYYFRVYTANANSRVLFKVCVSNVPPPSNNDCSNAITATTTNFNCLQTTNGTTVAATESMPRCSGTGVTQFMMFGINLQLQILAITLVFLTIIMYNYLVGLAPI